MGHLQELRVFLDAVQVLGAATQQQALNALVFFLQEVEGKELGDFGELTRARRQVRVPVVLTPEEVKRVLAAMTGTPQLVARLLYGSGLRLLEALRLRVQDLDFGRVIYTHVLRQGGSGMKSPLDCL